MDTFNFDRLDMTSANGARLNIEALYRIAPSVFTEARDPKTGKVCRKVDFEALRRLLGDDVVDGDGECYRFTWVGKNEAKAEAARPTDKTLRPVPEDSVDWDNTKNIYIEGDNLEVLKLLQRSYLGKVKMIYIDPPYNTGNDFVYDDDFSRTEKAEDLAAGNVDKLGLRYRKNTDSNGKFHSDWCSMIYPRLLVARTLLSDDGVIFISIDDGELNNLKCICNEIFGSLNFRNTILVRRRIKSLNSQFADNGLSTMNVAFEYVLVYAKSDAFLMQALRQKKIGASPKGRWDVFWSNADRPTMRYEILGFTPTTGQWRNSREKAEIAVANYKKYNDEYSANMSLEEYSEITGIKDFIRRIPNATGKNGGVQHWIAPSDTMLRTSNWTDIEVSQIGKEIDLPFDNPKSKQLMLELIKLIRNDKDFIIFDFFSGSATTAHAVMQLNAEDGGDRKFIMVQLPELTDENSDAYKAGYKNICEIGEERIRRAGKQIVENLESKLDNKERNLDRILNAKPSATVQILLLDQQKEIAKKVYEEKAVPLMKEIDSIKDRIANLDTGFRVFRLDGSNYEEVDKSPKEYSQETLSLFENNIKADRTDLDLLFGAMLAWGVMLDLPMTKETVDGCTVYTVNDGDLVACFSEGITDDVVKAMAAKMPLRVLFRDSCFTQDAQKINIYEQFKQLMNWTDDEAFKNIRVI